jgi:predicted DCC family thiol-disulfide oxidoreductase YuxK
MTPERVVIVYDGSCRFCTSQVRWIEQRDRDRVFEFVSSGATGLLDRFPQLRNHDLNSGLRAILPAGRVAIGADGVYEIALRLPGWRRLAWLYRVPGLGPLWRRVYAWIAARRYQLAGRCDESCPVPPPPRTPVVPESDHPAKTNTE